MNWSKINNKKWFIRFKKNELNIYNPINRIELGKFCYEKDNSLSMWIIGIGLAMFASVNLSGVVALREGLFYILGIVAYILSPILLLLGIFLLCINIKFQKIKMMYLYQLKDKQEKSKNKKSVKKT